MRAWLPGCEWVADPYSTAILLWDLRERAGSDARLVVFATHDDELELGPGHQGVLPSGFVSSLPPEQLEQHFLRQGEGYRVAPHLADVVLFGLHDLTSDPPFLRLDLIVARDLFRRLPSGLAPSVLQLFHYCLRPDGGLLVPSEVRFPELDDLFQAVDAEHGVYARRPGPQRRCTPTMLRRPASVLEDSGVRPPSARGRPVARLVTDHLLARHAPASATVARSGEVLHLTGPVGGWLALPVGHPRLNLFSLVSPPFRGELRSAVTRSVREGRPVTYVADGWGPTGTTRVTAESLVNPEDGSRIVLVLLSPSASSSEAGDEEGLRRDLADTQHHLRATIEELEVTHAELIGFYEELGATTEELHQANEELELSQSALARANAELSEKVRQLERANDDLRSFFSFSDLAVLLLDTDLVIRRSTPRAAELVAVREADMGRKISELTLQTSYPELCDDLQSVVSSGAERRRHVRHRDGRVYEARVVPVRAEGGDIEGVALSFVDVSAVETELRRQATLAHLGEMATTVAHEIRNPLAGIRGAIEVMSRGFPPDARERSVVETIVARIESLDRLVSDLLTFAKPVQVERAPTSVRAVIESAAESLCLRMPDMEVEIGGADATADIDPVLLEHVLFSLFLNGAQAMNEAGKLQVHVKRAGHLVRIRVRDHGPGIPHALRDRIFEPFVGMRANGPGLGLSIARRMMAAHGGTIEIGDDDDRGAVVDLVLPVHPTGSGTPPRPGTA